MHRLALAAVLLIPLLAHAQGPPPSDPFAMTLAQQSIAALTRGGTLSDVKLNADVTSTVSSNYDTGTATFYVKGTAESRVDFNFKTSGPRSDVRDVVTGTPGGAWATNGGTPTPFAPHNCWTDASWFFPTLSSLSQTANPNFVFSYVGKEQHGEVNTQHIRVYQWSAQGAPSATLMHDGFLSRRCFIAARCNRIPESSRRQYGNKSSNRNRFCELSIRQRISGAFSFSKDLWRQSGPQRYCDQCLLQYRPARHFVYAG